MTRRPPLTPEQKEIIADMRERGKSCEAIGRVLGASAGAVSWHCLVEGIESPRTATATVPTGQPMRYERNGFAVRRFTGADDKKLLELAASGLGNTAIGKQLGRRPNSVRGRLATLARQEAREERRRGVAA